MKEQLEARLTQLRSEFETGQARLQQLTQEETRLRETLLRISGAILVLEELMGTDKPATASNLPPGQGPG